MVATSQNSENITKYKLSFFLDGHIIICSKELMYTYYILKRINVHILYTHA